MAGADRAAESLRMINERARSAFGQLDIVLTLGPGDAEDLARRSVSDGYDLLLVAGGDGTLNEVINGVALVAGGLEQVTFGVMPLGTGNDFVRALGFPPELEGTLERIGPGLQTRALDLGALNGRLFANASGGGFIAEVSDTVDPGLKSWAGRLAYLIGGAQVLLDFEPVTGWIELEGQRHRLEANLFAVCNSRTQGGGHLIAPHALVDDGLLDVCVVAPTPATSFLGLLRSMSRGEHAHDERVAYVQTRSVRFEFDGPQRVNTDGEVLESRECAYQAMAGCARFLVDNPPFTRG